MTRLIWILPLAAMAGCTDGDVPAAAVHGAPPHAAERFVRVDEGIVRDTRSDLLWTAQDSSVELRWSAADERCRQLVRGSSIDTGATGWRLPTSEELAAIYDESQVQACGADRCRLDPAVDLTSPYQWSSTARGKDGDRRVYVDFRHGSELAPLLRPSLTRRALCVGERASRPR
jgi:hypothetical protein